VAISIINTLRAHPLAQDSGISPTRSIGAAPNGFASAGGGDERNRVIVESKLAQHTRHGSVIAGALYNELAAV
jgi:hypothetical protein